MSDSCLEAIESSVTAEVALAPGVISVSAVPLADLFPTTEDGTSSLDQMYLPAGYPGAIVSLNDDEVDLVDPATLQAYDTSRVVYSAPVYISVIATSDGTTSMGARRKAWQIADAILRRLVRFSPTGFPDGAQAWAPMKPGPMTAIVIDGNTHGVVMRFEALYAIEVTG